MTDPQLLRMLGWDPAQPGSLTLWETHGEDWESPLVARLEARAPVTPEQLQRGACYLVRPLADWAPESSDQLLRQTGLWAGWANHYHCAIALLVPGPYCTPSMRYHVDAAVVCWQQRGKHMLWVAKNRFDPRQRRTSWSHR